LIRLSGMRAQEFLDRFDKRIDGLASLAFDEHLDPKQLHVHLFLHSHLRCPKWQPRGALLRDGTLCFPASHFMTCNRIYCSMVIKQWRR